MRSSSGSESGPTAFRPRGRPSAPTRRVAHSLPPAPSCSGCVPCLHPARAALRYVAFHASLLLGVRFFFLSRLPSFPASHVLSFVVFDLGLLLGVFSGGSDRVIGWSPNQIEANTNQIHMQMKHMTCMHVSGSWGRVGFGFVLFGFVLCSVFVWFQLLQSSRRLQVFFFFRLFVSGATAAFRAGGISYVKIARAGCENSVGISYDKLQSLDELEVELELHDEVLRSHAEQELNKATSELEGCRCSWNKSSLTRLLCCCRKTSSLGRALCPSCCSLPLLLRRKILFSKAILARDRRHHALAIRLTMFSVCGFFVLTTFVLVLFLSAWEGVWVTHHGVRLSATVVRSTVSNLGAVVEILGQQLREGTKQQAVLGQQLREGTVSACVRVRLCVVVNIVGGLWCCPSVCCGEHRRGFMAVCVLW